MSNKIFIRSIATLIFFLCLNSSNYALISKDTALINSLIRRYKITFKSPEAKLTFDSIRVLSIKQNFTEGICFYYHRKTMAYAGKNILDTSQIYSDSLYTIAKTSGNKLYQALAFREKGRIFALKQDHDNAIATYLSALKLFDLDKPSVDIAATYQYIATEYYRMANLSNNKEYGKKSLEYFNLNLEMAQKTGSDELTARALNNIGTLHFHILNDYEKALEYFEKSLVIKTKLHSPDLISAYNNIGNSLCMIARRKKDNSFLLSRALENYDKGLQISKEKNDTLQLILVYSNMAAAYLELHQLDKVNEHLKKAKDLHAKKFNMSLHLAIMNVETELYAFKKDFSKAYVIFRRSQVIKDSLETLENDENLNKMQVEYGTFKKDKEIELLTKNQQINDLALAKKESDINRQRILIISVMVILAALLIFSFFIFKSNKEKQLINHRLAEQHKDITDSINYAKLIQQAIFPEKELKYRLFPDAFVLLMPKDVVSGDFYWFGEENNKRIIAAVDCTGHGVPGAFMSMIGNAFLNEIVHEKKITTPALILNELRTHVIQALKQEGSENKDGMDIAICAFDKDFKTVEYAGANNPLWLIRGEEVQQINADKQPIGLSGKELKDFTNHKIQLEKNDLVYIFTDGYADQFGGEKGKKFKYKPLQEFLKANKNRSMAEVEEVLINTFHTWKGNLDQVDDVCIIGIRI